MRVNLDYSDLEVLAKRLGDGSEFRKEFSIEFKNLGRKFNADSIPFVPVQTGDLLRSVRYIEKDLSFTLGINESKCPYAKFVYFGTKPHKIEAERRIIFKRVTSNLFGKGMVTYNRTYQSSLAFVPSGGSDFVFRGSVNHPGTKANPFFLKAWNASKDQFTKDLSKAITEIIIAETKV
jgi:hypothetical protein